MIQEGNVPRMEEAGPVVLDTTSLVAAILEQQPTVPVTDEAIVDGLTDTETPTQSTELDTSAIIGQIIIRPNGKDAPVDLHNNKSKRLKTRQTNTRHTGSESSDNIVRQYLREIGRYAVLTKEQEVELAQKIESGLEALEQMQSETITEEHRAQLEEAVALGKSAKDEFIKANLKLVVSIAKRYQGKGLELLDLIQEGNIGLEHAVDMFDWRKGFKFSTYSTWWIRQAVTRAIGNKAAAIRLPIHVHERAREYYQAKDRLHDEGKQQTFENIANEMGVSVRAVTNLVRHLHLTDVVMLDEPVSGGSNSRLFGMGTTYGELIPDLSAQEGFDEVEGDINAKNLRDVLTNLLDHREYTIVTERYGLLSGEPKTLDEVGKVVGLTRERVRQIETRALAKLRHPAASSHIGQFSF